MAKIGSFEYPEFQLKTLLPAMEILVTKYHGHIEKENTFAEALGHKSNKSGTFYLKLADLRRYGLIEKRSITATKLGKSISQPIRGDAERKESLSKTVEAIDLWIKLYNRLGTKTPNLDEFRLQLVEVTSDEDEARKNAEKIRNLYIEAIAYYDKEQVILSSNNSRESSLRKEERTANEGMEVITYKQIRIEYPKNDVIAIDRAIKLLQMAKEDLEKGNNETTD